MNKWTERFASGLESLRSEFAPIDQDELDQLCLAAGRVRGTGTRSADRIGAETSASARGVPSEQVMLVSLATVAGVERTYEVYLYTPDPEYGREYIRIPECVGCDATLRWKGDDPQRWDDSIPGVFVIRPQMSIGRFRADFLVVYRTTVITSVSEHKARTSIDIQVVVECDRHDFHEKTKEQASRDREKDRFIQQEGHKDSSLHGLTFGVTREATWSFALATSAC